MFNRLIHLNTPEAVNGHIQVFIKLNKQGGVCFHLGGPIPPKEKYQYPKFGEQQLLVKKQLYEKRDTATMITS